MPIYEYVCETCGAVTTVIQYYDKAPPCEVCTGRTHRVPSIPGYRRDHTVEGDD